MNTSIEKGLLDYAWKYFSYHADQRLKSFNFFLLFLTVGIAGLLAHAEHLGEPMFAIGGGLGLLVLTFLFWKLDRRHRTLVHMGENALKAIEDEVVQGDVAVNLKIFHAEEKETKSLREATRPIRYLTCTDCFNLMFAVITFLGIIGIARGILILVSDL